MTIYKTMHKPNKLIRDNYYLTLSNIKSFHRGIYDEKLAPYFNPESSSDIITYSNSIAGLGMMSTIIENDKVYFYSNNIFNASCIRSSSSNFFFPYKNENGIYNLIDKFSKNEDIAIFLRNLYQKLSNYPAGSFYINYDYLNDIFKVNFSIKEDDNMSEYFQIDISIYYTMDDEVSIKISYNNQNKRYYSILPVQKNTNIYFFNKTIDDFIIHYLSNTNELNNLNGYKLAFSSEEYLDNFFNCLRIEEMYTY